MYPQRTAACCAGCAADAATGGGPAHYGPALPGGVTGARIRSLRANASRKATPNSMNHQLSMTGIRLG